MPKLKTNRGAAKRFKRTASGKFKRSQSHLRHILTKKSTKRKPALSDRGRKIVSVTKKTEKKRITKSSRSLKALRKRAMELGKKHGDLKKGWLIAKDELAYADARGNPKRRRKNGTRKGMRRKTARRAYMRNRR